MIRVLHVARFAVVPEERRIMEMAGRPGLALRLVRPPRLGGPFDAEVARDRSRLENVRLVRVWRAADPHRGLYATLGFGIRASAPDIIHAEEEPDSLAALHLSAARRVLAPGARLVLNTWQNVNRPKRASVSWVLARTLAAADAIVCGNQGAVAVLREMGYGGPAPVIPALALDPAIYHRRTVPRLAPVFTVGCIARLVHEKGVDTLIRAMAKLGPPALLAVVGTGPLRAALEELARALGIGDSVRFLGRRDPRGVAEFLSAIDVLAVPSRSSPVWQEQYGRVIVEAMGCGAPVVGSTSGAIPETIADAGLLFPEDDADALAGRLGDLRASPALGEEVASRGLGRALSAHSAALRADQTLAFYRQLLGAPEDSAP